MNPKTLEELKNTYPLDTISGETKREIVVLLEEAYAMGARDAAGIVRDIKNYSGGITYNGKDRGVYNL